MRSAFNVDILASAIHGGFMLKNSVNENCRGPVSPADIPASP